MNNPISFQNLRDKTRKMVTEFTLPCIFAVLLAVSLVTMIITEDYDGAVAYYFTAAYLLSLMLKLWADEVTNKRMALGVSIAAHALLLADAIVLFVRDSGDIEISTYIAHSAVYLALVLGIFFLPFVREKNDIASWNFVRSLIAPTAVSFLIGGVMTAGVGLLIMGIGQIFNIEIEAKVYWTVAVLFMQLLPMLLLLSRIPMGEERHDRKPFVSGFLNGTTRYLFIPLTCLYILVLYVHLASILMTWELPNGAVSMLVSIMMCGIILVEFLLYPTIQSGAAKRFEAFIVKWMPIAALPLVMLMTVGIVRRFDDYGVTANRLYLLTLNLWFYIVCIGLFVTRAHRIHWVSLSFCALLLLTSAHPFNYFELVRKSMTAKIEALIEKYPPAAMPMKSRDEVHQWVSTLPEDQRSTAYSQLCYLLRYYNRDNIKDLVKDTYLYGEYDDSDDGKCREQLFSYTTEDSVNIDIPDGYSHVFFWYISGSNPVEESIDGDSITLSIDEIRGHKTAIYGFSRKTLKAYGKSDEQPLFLDTTGSIAMRPDYLTLEMDSTHLYYHGECYFFVK